MNMMERQISTPVKQIADQPANTLLFVDNDDLNVNAATETYNNREKKTEKSVHFASEDESLSSSQQSQSVADSLQTSRDLISWIPSEHLYSEDTFIPETHAETHTGNSGQATTGTPSTAVSYGSSTFIDLESEDETKTESEYSFTESISSSDVFSSRSGSATYREWKDVTEIVKDIEELEESEFVTRADVDKLAGAEDYDTDFSDSLDEEMAEQVRQDFLLATLRRLRLGSVYSPRSLAIDSLSTTLRSGAQAAKGEGSKDQMSFCQKMIKRCKAQADGKPVAAPTRTTDLHKKAELSKHAQVLEHYGVSSALVDRLRVDNLYHQLDRKAKRLDEEAEKSMNFVKEHQDVEAEMAKRKFMSQIQARVQNEKTEERIQAHLIRMHPVKWFSDFVLGLPRWDEDAREILYKYKRQVEKRMEEPSE